MQCRALARHSEHGSLTVLGDLAQGTSPWATSDWHEQMSHLGKDGSPVAALTMGFRVPAVVLAFANRLLPGLHVMAPPTLSIRTDGALRVRHEPDLASVTIAASSGVRLQPGCSARPPGGRAERSVRAVSA